MKTNTPARPAATSAGPERRQTAEALEPDWNVMMNRCLAQLDEGHRHILMLRIGLRLSYDEIAVELRTHADSARARVRQARGCLHALLARNYPDFIGAAPLLG